MTPLPLRLPPGADLRNALTAQATQAAFVLAGIGSLSVAQIRLAGAAQAITLQGDLEILSLCGTLADNGAHLHISVADAQGRVIGGHVAPGCVVRTTAELLLAVLPDWHFTRQPDIATGFAELFMQHRGEPADPLA